MEIVDQEFDPAIPVADLIEHPQNAHQGDDDLVSESVDTLGFFGAVLVQRSTNYVIAGNTRLRTARRKGADTIPGFWLDVDDETALRILLIDNRATEVATYDNEGLADVLSLLAESEAGLTATGFDQAFLDALLATDDGPVVDDDDGDEGPQPPTIPTDTVTQPGDVWSFDDGSRLMCGSCRDPEHVATLLDGYTVNLAVTSPPYADRREYDESSGFQPIRPDEYVDWFEAVQANVARHLADDGSWFVNIKPSVTPDGLDTEMYVIDLVVAHRREWGWHFATEFCWERNGVPKSVTQRFKNAFEPVYQFTKGRWKMRPDNVRHASDNVPTAMGEGVGDTGWAREQGGGAVLPQQRASVRRRQGGTRLSMSDVQGVSAAPGEYIGEGMAYPSNRLPTFAGSHEAVGHSAAFPVGLPGFFVLAYTDPGDAVYDPFVGSGSTIIAAMQSNRLGFGMELSKGYCDVAVARIERATGMTPYLNGEAHSMSHLFDTDDT